MIKEFDFTPYFHSPEILAAKVLEVYFDNENPSYPIDPFKMLVMFGVIYQFRDFKDIEGIYLVPQDSDDISIVGINLNRPIPRQRFTAAHELCHHIKDRTLNSICSFGNQRDPKSKDILEIAESRYNKGSTVLSGQVSHTQWYDIFPDPTIADAIMDRVIHNAYILNLENQGFRIVRKGKVRMNYHKDAKRQLEIAKNEIFP